MWRGIVGKRFSGVEFETYVAGLDFKRWRPDFVVLHNTGVPCLAQRPDGFTAWHMENLAGYYRGQGWSAGPHLFVDQHGIWAFSPLVCPGVHSPSWNACSWGVEMLGDYDHDIFDTGPGAAVRDNAVSALATLHARLGLDSHTLHFHHDDPRTSHRDCPGAHVSKPDIIARVHDEIVRRKAGG